MIGKWIDSLSEEELDGILMHPDSNFTGDIYYSSRLGCGCLVGAASCQEAYNQAMIDYIETDRHTSEKSAPDSYNKTILVSVRFPQLTARFGPQRVWRACKLRAIKVLAAKTSKVSCQAQVEKLLEEVRTGEVVHLENEHLVRVGLRG